MCSYIYVLQNGGYCFRFISHSGICSSGPFHSVVSAELFCVRVICLISFIFLNYNECFIIIKLANSLSSHLLISKTFSNLILRILIYFFLNYYNPQQFSIVHNKDIQMSKPIDRVPHQSDYFQDEFLKLIHSDKVYAMLSKLVDDYLVEKINDKVKAYCKKYIRKEMKSIRAGLQHNQAHYTGRNSSVDKVSFSRRDQSSGTCRRCKGLRAASNASKNQMLFDDRKVQKLERVQSEQRLKQNKISVEGEQMKNKLKKKCIHSPKTDSQANKHKVRLRKQKMLLEQRPPKQEKRKRAESIRQRINRKREKIMQYLNGQDKFFSEKELDQLIKENINLKTKQIINIIKSREQILSPILKVQPEKNFNFSQYSIHVKQQKERQENQHLHLTVMYPNTIEEYQNLSLDDLFHFKKQKKFKNCKDKGKIFLRMMDMFPQDSRTDIYKFIQTNQSLDEDQLIEKWAAKSQKYGIFA